MDGEIRMKRNCKFMTGGVSSEQPAAMHHGKMHGGLLRDNRQNVSLITLSSHCAANPVLDQTMKENTSVTSLGKKVHCF